MTATTGAAVLHQVADALLLAERSGSPIAPLSQSHPQLTVDDAYAIQTINVESRAVDASRPARVVGHKIGLTSRAMQRMLGVDVPDYGVLYEDRVYDTGVTIDSGALIAPRIEPELAFVLSKTLRGPDVTARDVLAATEAVLPAVEVIDSRIADWKIGLVDTVADNASCHCAVLGTERRAPADIDMVTVAVRLLVDGEVVQRGTGEAVLGDPAEAVAWLANAIARYGHELEAGEIVLSGSMTAAVPLEAGSRVVADFGPFGRVEVQAR